jgi:hypothetical protein
MTENFSADQKARFETNRREALRRLAHVPKLNAAQLSLKHGIPLDCIFSLSTRNSLKHQPAITSQQFEFSFA